MILCVAGNVTFPSDSNAGISRVANRLFLFRSAHEVWARRKCSSAVCPKVMHHPGANLGVP